MKTIFKIIAPVLLVLCAFQLKAQPNGNKLIYNYDENGNRINRTKTTVTLLGKFNASDTTLTKKDKPVVNNTTNDFEVNVGPNPTNSNLKIELLNKSIKQDTYFEYVLSSSTGATLIASKVNSNNTSIDLTPLPDGMYILKLISNNITNTYKIVKANY